MSALNRLRWKCRRGMLELDLVLQHFLERDYAALDAPGKAAFEALLESGDEELWAMISGESASTLPACDAVIERLRAC
jgi:succinate dehydrogenase flavin-adding protein (antitoxin of CptAB toxin-antitoxin module)